MDRRASRLQCMGSQRVGHNWGTEHPCSRVALCYSLVVYNDSDSDWVWTASPSRPHPCCPFSQHRWQVELFLQVVTVWVKTITQTELRVLLFMDSPENCGCLAEIHMTGHLCVMSVSVPLASSSVRLHLFLLPEFLNARGASMPVSPLGNP